MMGLLTGIAGRRMVFGLLRHGLTVAGGVLVANGYADAATVDTITGGGMAAAGVLWSVLDKRF